MKISKTQLKQIIKEELERELLDEAQSMSSVAFGKELVGNIISNAFDDYLKGYIQRAMASKDKELIAAIQTAQEKKADILQMFDHVLIDAFEIVQGERKDFGSINAAGQRFAKKLEDLMRSLRFVMGDKARELGVRVSPRNQRDVVRSVLLATISETIAEEMFRFVGSTAIPQPEVVKSLSKLRINKGFVDKLKGFFGAEANEDVVKDIKKVMYVFIYIVEPALTKLEGPRPTAAATNIKKFVADNKPKGVDGLQALVAMKDDPNLMSGDSNK